MVSRILTITFEILEMNKTINMHECKRPLVGKISFVKYTLMFQILYFQFYLEELTETKTNSDYELF